MDFYSKNAATLATQYNQLNPKTLHAAWLYTLPSGLGKLLDIGAGSGRDALWFAEKGWQVTAVEPCSAFIEMIPEHDNIEIIRDSLPDLAATPSDVCQLILVSAVWMHLTPLQQAAALTVIKPRMDADTLLIITWRNDTEDSQREFYPVNSELFGSAQIHSTSDQMGRQDVQWHCAVIKKENL
ncbi:Uncharacterised protein [BD1-7 clade bacterium]|nr:Uncharacterised protein [BD1-7 clade bacterium]